MIERSGGRTRFSYQTNAKYYDLAVRLFGFLGVRHAFRAKAVDRLGLRRGDHVVELGCGTGLNFPLIQQRIGAEGRLIGVDFAPAMLERAKRRVLRAGWENVELVDQDISAYEFPKKVNGVLATGVLGYLEEPDSVISRALDALAPGGRFVILDGKDPGRLPSWLFRLIVLLARRFGANRRYFDNSTWESVRRHFDSGTFEQMCGGLIFLAHTTARRPQASDSAKHLLLESSDSQTGKCRTDKDMPRNVRV